jgi:hypothetical protein
MVEGELVLIPETVAREKEKEEKKLRPYQEVAKLINRSTHTVRSWLNRGLAEGVRRRRKDGGRGNPEMWWMSLEAAKKHLDSIKTPSEYGRRGGRPRKKAAASAA